MKTDAPNPDLKRVAWEVMVNGFSCITFAETKAKATWNAVNGYRKAYNNRRGYWPPVSTRRINRLDNHSECNKPGRKCYGLDQL